MQLLKRFSPAFTLVEVMVTSGVVAISGGVIFMLLSMGMTLYTQNISIGQTHSAGLVSSEKLLLKVAAATEVPVLVDDAGATQVGNGPAAGVRFFSPASSQAYPVPLRGERDGHILHHHPARGPACPASWRQDRDVRSWFSGRGHHGLGLQ